MKSGIENTRHDAFGLMGLVEEEHDCICGSQGKGRYLDYNDRLQENELTNLASFLGDVNCLDSSIEECMDYTDSQLEHIILTGGLCGDGHGDEIFKLMNDLKDEETTTQPHQEHQQQEDHDSTPNIANVPDVASYIEVETSEEVEISEVELSTSNNLISSPSYYTVSSPSNVSVISQPYARFINTRSSTRKKKPKRVHDDRVKLQNKMAAIKYRERKRHEQEEVETDIKLEEEKNKKLKANIEELEVKIRVLKDFIDKVLDSKKTKPESS